MLTLDGLPPLWYHWFHFHTHSKVRSITHVATKAHMILRSFVVFTWMRDTIEYGSLWNNTKEM